MHVDSQQSASSSESEPMTANGSSKRAVSGAQVILKPLKILLPLSMADDETNDKKNRQPMAEWLQTGMHSVAKATHASGLQK